MPLFYFSTDDSFDAEDGLEYPDATAAREAGAEALRHMASENMARSAVYRMTIWDEAGEVVSKLQLTVNLQDMFGAEERPRKGRSEMH